jgi:ribosomal protein L21E
MVRRSVPIEPLSKCYELVALTSATWAKDLSFMELAYNRQPNASTSFSPFEVVYGRRLHTPNELGLSLGDFGETSKKDVETYWDRQRQLMEQARDALIAAQKRQTEYYNKSRVPLEFKVGDLVIVDAPHMNTAKSGLGQQKYQGPFFAIEKISSHAYKLDLPPSSHVHPVFHVSHLHPYNAREPTAEDSPRSVLVDDVLSHRVLPDGKRRFLLSCVNHPSYWCDEANLPFDRAVRDAIERYKRRLQRQEKPW